MTNNPGMVKKNLELSEKENMNLNVGSDKEIKFN